MNVKRRALLGGVRGGHLNVRFSIQAYRTQQQTAEINWPSSTNTDTPPGIASRRRRGGDGPPHANTLQVNAATLGHSLSEPCSEMRQWHSTSECCFVLFMTLLRSVLIRGWSMRPEPDDLHNSHAIMPQFVTEYTFWFDAHLCILHIPSPRYTGILCRCYEKDKIIHHFIYLSRSLVYWKKRIFRFTQAYMHSLHSTVHPICLFTLCVRLC